MAHLFAKFLDLMNNAVYADNPPTATVSQPTPEILSEFKAYIPQPSASFFPLARSGHRCFCDDDYYYVLGGFSNTYGGLIFREFWALNLTSYQWRRYQISGEFPDKLASFSCAQLEPFSKTIICFGGSGTCFGASSTNDSFVLSIDNEKCQIFGRRLKTHGTIPVAKYGHAMCRGEKPNKLYVIGGTQGEIFDMNIHTLEYKTDEETAPKWTWKHVNADMKEQIGRYRMEATYDEKRQVIWFFGGGDITNVINFETIEGFNVVTNKPEKIQAKADARGKFPAGRRCHSMTRLDRDIIIVGGAGGEQRHHVNGRIIPQTTIMKDIWIFNLDTHQWRQHHTTLVIPVFFHDAAITKDGLLIIFGGTVSTNSTHRTSAFQYAWFRPPTLRRAAAMSLKKNMSSVLEGFDGGKLNCSKDCVEIYQRITDPEYRQQCVAEQFERQQGVPHRKAKNDKIEYNNGRNRQFMIQHRNNGAYRRVEPYRREDERVARLRHIFVRREMLADQQVSDSESDSDDNLNDGDDILNLQNPQL